MQRAKLHHSWLLNRYVTFLKANLDTINCPTDENIIEGEVLEQLLSWNARKVHIRQLISGVLLAVSPKQLIDELPLKNLSDEVRQMLSVIIHDLYLRDSAIIAKIQLLSEACDKVDYLVANAEMRLKCGQVTGNNSYGDELLEAILSLSSLISSLPHSIQIPFGACR